MRSASLFLFLSVTLSPEVRDEHYDAELFL